MNTVRILFCLTIFGHLSSSPKSSGAASSVAGTYANLSFNVDGGGGQNRLMPRLELRADQTFLWGRESGTYQVREGGLYFSGSYSTWGPGRVDKDRKIWFQFTKGGKHFVVTMYRVGN